MTFHDTGRIFWVAVTVDYHILNPRERRVRTVASPDSSKFKES